MCKLLANSLLNSEIYMILGVAVGIFILFLIIRYLYKLKKQPKYFLKDSLLTKTEIAYYDVIRALLGEEYLVLPQINLASVIDKQGGGNFRSELFRNIDFGIFDFNFKPILLIEINDNTHLRKDRIERDKKVNKICKKAGVELVTFWVKDGFNVNDIRKKLYSALRRA